VDQTSPKIDFEQQLSNLESLVTSLEGGDLTLEESLSSFEQGIKIARECQQALQVAEQRVEVLMKQGDEIVSQPFVPENN
jgi:exodeoxyribonuclease VII small subunit